MVWPGLIGAVEVKTEEAVAGNTIELKDRLRPSLPFPPDDPWLGQPAGTGDLCAGKPAYRPIELNFSSRYGKPINYHWTGGSLPTFAEIGWLAERPLPQRIELRLEQQRPENPAFKTSLKIGWNLATDRAKPLVAWAKNRARRAYPVVLKTPPAIGFDNALEIHWYPTRDACVGGDKSQGYWDYALGAFTDRHKGLCNWASLMRDSERISHCTQPGLNRTGDQLELDFRSLNCGAYRRLILIALSEVFDSIGKDLKDALRERLVRMKESGSRVPFDLLSIGEDGRFKRVLACEDLPDLAEDGEISIRAAIAPLRFRSQNLETLENLGPVPLNPKFAANRIRSILYLTDGDGLEEIDDRNEIPSRIALASRAPILEWQNEKIDFHILTAGSCTTWRTMGVECEELRKDRTERLDLITNRIDRALAD